MADTERVRLVADPYPPYQYADGPEVRGVDHDVIVAAFREAGLEATTTLLPWDECVEAVRNGTADGIFQIQRTPEREAMFLFSDPLRTARTVFFANRETHFHFPPEADPLQILAAHNLGIVRGYGYDPRFAALPDSGKVVVETQEELLLGLASSHYDVAIIDLGVAAYLKDKLGLADLEKVEGFEIARVLHVAFHKGRQEWVGRFNAGLRRMHEEGIHAAILARYALVE